MLLPRLGYGLLAVELQTAGLGGDEILEGEIRDGVFGTLAEARGDFM